MAKQRPKPEKSYPFEMILLYGQHVKKPIGGVRGENVQRLVFKNTDKKISTAMKKALTLTKLIKRSGNYKAVTLLALSRLDAFKRYMKEPSALGYIGNPNKDKFVKDAVDAAKKNQKALKATKLVTRKAKVQATSKTRIGKIK